MRRFLVVIGSLILASVLALPAVAQDAKPVSKERKIRVALAGLFEEVNTFADETMGKAKITGNMTTGFQQWSDQGIFDEYRGTETYLGGYIAALEEFPEVEIVPSDPDVLPST